MGINPFRSRSNGSRGRTSNVKEKAGELKGRAKHATREIPSSEHVQEQAQGRAAETLSRAERMPDSLYLAAVFGSMAISLLLLLNKRREMSLFVGLWPVTILNLAIMLKERHPSREVASMRNGSGRDVERRMAK